MSPSIPFSSSTKIPYGMIFTTLPVIILPSAYFSSTSSQGLLPVCLRPRDTFMLSLSKSSTFTARSSPTCTTSDGWPTRPQLISVMCRRPVIPPPISMNAPKSVMFRTMPLTTSPLFRPSMIIIFSPRLFSSTSSFLDRTMFLRGIFIFTIMNSIRLPNRLSAPPKSCITARLAGKKASMPISTMNPPLTLRNTLPSMMSPSF